MAEFIKVYNDQYKIEMTIKDEYATSGKVYIDLSGFKGLKHDIDKFIDYIKDFSWVEFINYIPYINIDDL